MGELREGGERLVVAKGGYGGRGNAATKVWLGTPQQLHIFANVKRLAPLTSRSFRLFLGCVFKTAPAQAPTWVNLEQKRSSNSLIIVCRRCASLQPPCLLSTFPIQTLLARLVDLLFLVGRSRVVRRQRRLHPGRVNGGGSRWSCGSWRMWASSGCRARGRAPFWRRPPTPSRRSLTTLSPRSCRTSVSTTASAKTGLCFFLCHLMRVP